MNPYSFPPILPRKTFSPQRILNFSAYAARRTSPEELPNVLLINLKLSMSARITVNGLFELFVIDSSIFSMKRCLLGRLVRIS